jgi:hypothetical protein
MEVVFTYIPIRKKYPAETYLAYSIENLNNQNVIPILYSDKDYLCKTNLKYKWVKLDESEYKMKGYNLWSYPKLKVLSTIDFPFIHLDNDLIVDDFSKLKSIIDTNKLNLAYKHPLSKAQTNSCTEIYKRYSNIPLDFEELNNTCVIASNDYLNINKAYSDVIKIIDENFDFFIERYDGIPPITLNQQYVNLYFNDINYLYDKNPSVEDIKQNGILHLAEKNLVNLSSTI